MEIIQATVLLFGVFIALLAMLFIALVAGAAAVDRGRVPVAARRADGFRR